MYLIMNFKTLTLSLILSTTLVSTQVLAKGTVYIEEDGEVTAINRPILSMDAREEQAKKRAGKEKFQTTKFGKTLAGYSLETVQKYVRANLFSRDVQDWLLAKEQDPSELGLEIEYEAIAKAYSIASQKGNYWEDLEEIDLSSQGLSVLPWEMIACSHARRIILAQNDFSELPDAVSAWSVETLDLQANPFENLPTALGLCRNLRHLYLSPETTASRNIQLDPSNKVRSLPVVLETLRKERENAKRNVTTLPSPTTNEEALGLVKALKQQVLKQEEEILRLEEGKKEYRRAGNGLQKVLKGLLFGDCQSVSSKDGIEVKIPIIGASQGLKPVLLYIARLQERISENEKEIEREKGYKEAARVFGNTWVGGLVSDVCRGKFEDLPQKDEEE